MRSTIQLMTKNQSPDNYFRFILLFSLIVSTSCSTRIQEIPSAASYAKELRESQKHEKAIEVYRKHIKARLKDKAKPDFENPYFYNLLIADTYLEIDKPLMAEEAINQAQKELVSQEFLVDRYRQIVSWYENNQQLKKAHQIANKYRELSPDTFDIDIDRLNKKIVSEEQKR